MSLPETGLRSLPGSVSLAEELGLPASLGRVPVPGQRGAPGRDPRVGVAAEPARRGSGSISAGRGREPCRCSELCGFVLPAQLGAGRPWARVVDVPGPGPAAALLRAVRRERGAGTGFLSLGSPGWGQPGWTCLEHMPVPGRWELPPHPAPFPSEDRSVVLFNLGSHQCVLASGGIDARAGPTAA